MSEIIVKIVLATSWILQLIGLLIILGSNARFYHKARTGKYHSVKKEFVAQTMIQIAPDEEELLKANADEIVKKIRIANLLYENYRDSMYGIVFTLVGVIVGVVTLTQI